MNEWFEGNRAIIAKFHFMTKYGREEYWSLKCCKVREFEDFKEVCLSMMEGGEYMFLNLEIVYLSDCIPF